MSKRTNRKFMQHFVVPASNQAVPTGALVNGSNAYNLLNGQVGTLAWDFQGTVPLGEFIPAGTTSTNVPAVKVVQGTEASQDITRADVFEVGPKDKIESGILRQGNIRSVSTTKYDVGNFSVSAANDFANVVGETEYTAFIRILSHRRDRDFGHNDDVLQISFETPDYANLALGSDTDHLLSTLVYKINQRSYFTPGGTGAASKGTRPIIAFGVDISGGTGQALGTITVGTQISYQVENGVTAIYTATPAFVAAIGELIAEGTFLVTSTAQLVDIEVAGAGTVDAVFVVGFDERTAAYFDDIAFTRTSVEVSYGGGFMTPATRPNIIPIYARQEANSGRQMLIAFRNAAGLNVHTMQNHPHGEYFSRGKEYVKEEDNYNLTIVEYTEVEETLTGTVVTQAKLYIPVTAAITDLATTAANVATNIGANNQPYPTSTSQATTVLELNDTLGAWLATSPGIEYGGIATGTTIFV